MATRASSMFLTIAGITLGIFGIVLYLVGQATITEIVAGFPTFRQAEVAYLVYVFGAGILLGIGTTAIVLSYFGIRATPLSWQAIVSLVLGGGFLLWGTGRIAGHEFLPLTRFGLFWYGVSAGTLLSLAGLVAIVRWMRSRWRSSHRAQEGKTQLRLLLAVLGIGGIVAVVAFTRQQQESPESVKGEEAVSLNSAPPNLNAPEQLPPTTATQIRITAEGFVPSIVQIPAGSVVVWVNEDARPHYVAPDDHPDHRRYAGVWDDNGSGFLGPGGRYVQQFSRAGSYGYHDHLLPALVGTVVVREEG